MSNFVVIVTQVDELTTLARDASKFATRCAKYADNFVFVASVCAVLNIVLNVYMINKMQQTQINFNETLVAFLVTSTGIVFATMIFATSKMAAMASSAVDASAAAARAVLSTEVVLEAISTAATRAAASFEEDEIR